jgi:tRNA pseudouridine55 synthase
VSVYILDKPLGLTSHKVVSIARQTLGTKRVGHAGTLDPLATGVLVLLTGQATKLSPFLSKTTKRYLACVVFGASTLTLDAEGPVSHEANPEHLTRELIEAVLPNFLILKEQVPPQFSAIKHRGVPSYRLARRGQPITHGPRPARYHEITLLGFYQRHADLPSTFSTDVNGYWRPRLGGFPFKTAQPLRDYPSALFDLEVGAGTYARSFARDLGAFLGVPSHLGGLVRTQAGQFDLSQAVSLESLEPHTGISLADALPYPLVRLDSTEVQRVLKGQRLPLQTHNRHGLIGPDGRLIAVAEAVEDRMRLLRVFPL